MITYCIATYCPLAGICLICKTQAGTDTNNYQNFSGELRATYSGWQCPKLEVQKYYTKSDCTSD